MLKEPFFLKKKLNANINTISFSYCDWVDIIQTYHKKRIKINLMIKTGLT